MDRYCLHDYLIVNLWYIFRDVDIFNVFGLYFLDWHHHNPFLIINISLQIRMIRNPFLSWSRLIVTDFVARNVIYCRRWVALLVWKLVIVDRLRYIEGRQRIIGWIVIELAAKQLRLVINGSSIIIVIVGRVV